MLQTLDVLGLEIDTYALLLAVSATVAGLLLAAELRRRGRAPGLAALIVAAGVGGGFVGGKLYYVLYSRASVDLTSPRTYLEPTGTAWYGAFLLGTLAILLVLRWMDLPLLATLDLLAPIVPVAQAIGRLGCLCAGCCRGAPADLPWAVSYPHGWPRLAHPAPLYEAVYLMVAAALLWRLRDRLSLRPGALFGWYLVLAGFGRFAVEFYRLNREVLGFLTVPQLAAVLGMIVGVILISRRGGIDRGGAS
jgi:phosphatidylglycerol:prolipoprotein diacylglycerol transferase